MENYHLRPATLSDAEGIALARHQSWQETYTGIIHSAYLAAMSEEEGIARWKNILSQPGADRFTAVLICDDKIAGFVSGGRSRSDSFNVDGEIYALYLLKEYHGRGLGAKLFINGVEELKRIGYKSFCLYVLTQNPAVGFYKKFKPALEDEDVVEIGEETYSDTGLAWMDIEKFS
jgi:ribosomal protein S18 acetylase RimI-like enzyme